jgi:hypothetical protein
MTLTIGSKKAATGVGISGRFRIAAKILGLERCETEHE